MSSDKYLTVKEWQKFAKPGAYKDAGFLKALAAAEKAAKAPAQEQLKLLYELEEEGRALARLGKGDKKLESYLDDVYKALKKWRKDAEDEAKEQSEQEDEEGGDSPVLLQARMIPLLRQIKKGEVMQALIALAGKDTAVLIAKRSIAPSRRELIQKFLGASGGVKWIKATCLWELEAHTFVVEGAAAGLAKKLKAALLAQVELRLKVRVRGEDPNDVDEELGEADEAEGEEEGEGAETAQAPTIPTPPPLPLPPPGPAFNARLAALMPRIKTVLAGAGGPVLREKITAAGELARKQDYEAAHARLDEAEQLLAGGGAPAAPGAPRIAPKIAFTQTRLAWDRQRKQVQADLRRVEAAVLEACREEEDFSVIARNIGELYTVLDHLDERLIDKLDEALNAEAAEVRNALHQQAREIVDEYIAYVNAEELLAAIDDNGFVAVGIKPSLNLCLTDMAQQLRAAA